MIKEVGMIFITLAMLMTILIVVATSFYCIYKDIKRKDYKGLIIDTTIILLINGVILLFIGDVISIEFIRG